MVSGDQDHDGFIIQAKAIDLNGVSITDATGNAADLGYGEGGHYVRFLVDALPRDVVNIATTTSGQEVIITFREEIGPAPLLLRAAQAVGVDAGVFYQALFNIYVDSFEVVPSGASITGRQLSLFVQHPITDVQEVAVSYDNLFAKAAPGILLDQGGNPLASFEKRGGGGKPPSVFASPAGGRRERCPRGPDAEVLHH